MEFNPPLQQATLLRRYKRFLADVRTDDGTEMTIHCPNTGSMKHCAPTGARVLYSDSGNPARKYRYTLEAVQVAHGHWAGVNTNRTNSLVAEAIEQKKITGLKKFKELKREVTYTDSRFDIALYGVRQVTYVEVKNVTLGPGPEDNDDGVIAFPDSVTERGQKHLQTLMQAARDGHKAVLFFCVQHTGAKSVRPADEIDARYGELLRDAADAGVRIMAWKTHISSDEFVLANEVPVRL